MGLKFTRLEIPDVILVEPQIHGDSRGFFLETYHRKKYEEGGIRATFVQDNYSRSAKNILRGLHYQKTKPQAKLITCLDGEIFDVAVDIRRDSPTFGKWISAVLSGENKRQLFIPEGFAHGFCVLSEKADVHYKCSDFYDPEDEGGILWSDPGIGVRWPVGEVVLSEKDARHPVLRALLSSAKS